MFNRLQLLVLTGLFSFVTMPVLAGETGRLASLGVLKDTVMRSESFRASHNEETTGAGDTFGKADLFSPSPQIPQSPSQPSSIDLLAQNNVTRVTGIEVNQTAKGLELVLKTVAGSERLVPLILPEGNDLVIDLLDATLAFSIRNGVTELNPAPGINKITVNKVNDNSIRVRIAGANQTPSAEVLPGRDDLVLSIAPEGATTEQEPDEEIEVIATGQAEDEDDYFVPDASSTLRTDVELRDTPASVQVIPQQVIKDQSADSVREVVRNASGVNFAESGGNRTEQFIIRGFVAENGIFRNGFRDDFFTIRAATELANIDRIEVLKGPAAILFGRTDPAGIINYVTKQPLREPFYEVGFTAGSFDFYRPTIDFSGPLTENGNLAYRLNAAYESAGSFRDGVERDRFFVAPILSWQISDDTELTLEYSYLNSTQPVDRGLVVLSDNEVADIPFSTFLGDPDARQDVEENRTELYLDHRFNDNLSLRTLLRYTTATETGAGITSQISDDSEDDRNFPVEEGSDAEGFFETFTIQNDLTGKFNTGSLEHTVLFGVEYFTGSQDFISETRPSGTIDIFNASAFEPATDEPFELQFEGEFTTDSFGIFLQDQIAILDNLQLVIGGRFDTVDIGLDFNGEFSLTEGDAFTPRVGIVYQPIEPVSLYASFSTSFFPAEGMDISGEPFDPTKGTAFEIGVKTEIIKDKLSSSLALYDTTLTNVTTTDPNDSDFSIQTGEQNSQGIELDVQGEILPGWNIFAGYAYTDAEVTEDNVIPEGNRLTNVPENNFNLWTTYTLQKGSLAGLGFGAGVFFIDERAGDIDNSFFVDAYTRVDAAIYYEKKNYRAAVNFKNLFNADFIEGTSGRQRIQPGAPFAVQGTANGDVIFVWTYEDKEEMARESQTALKKLKADPLWSKLNAVQQDKVYEVPGYWIGMGPIAANLVLDDLFEYLVEE